MLTRRCTGGPLNRSSLARPADPVGPTGIDSLFTHPSLPGAVTACESTEGEEGASITSSAYRITVDEGRQYVVGDITFAGNEVFGDDRLESRTLILFADPADDAAAVATGLVVGGIVSEVAGTVVEISFPSRFSHSRQTPCSGDR